MPPSWMRRPAEAALFAANHVLTAASYEDLQSNDRLKVCPNPGVFIFVYCLQVKGKCV